MYIILSIPHTAEESSSDDGSEEELVFVKNV